MGIATKLLLGSALTLGFLEAGACVVVDRLRPDGVLEAAVPEAAAGRTPEGTASVRSEPRLAKKHVVHPYLGFMAKKAPEPRSAFVHRMDRADFYLPSSPAFSQDENDLIVGITGGSVSSLFAMGAGSETLREELAEMPRFAGRNIEFLVLGAGGVKQPQQLIALEWLLIQGGRVDVLINIDGFNEIALHEIDNEPHGVAPIYPRMWRLRVGRLDVAELFGEREYLEGMRRDLATGLAESPLKRLHLRQLLWIARDRALRYATLDVENRLRSEGIRRSEFFAGRGPRRPDSTIDSRREAMVELWKQGSLMIDERCEARQIEYYHFLQPNQHVVGSKPLTDEEKKSAIGGDDGYGAYVPAAYPLLRDAGVELYEAGVRFHDLTDVFADRTETLYIDTCCHVNELGNELLAHAIAEAIESWGR
ncbi:MAG: hypothetical protein AAF726_13915 [Planctomycetota bacterium]